MKEEEESVTRLIIQDCYKNSSNVIFFTDLIIRSDLLIFTKKILIPEIFDHPMNYRAS